MAEVAVDGRSIVHSPVSLKEGVKWKFSTEEIVKEKEKFPLMES